MALGLALALACSGPTTPIPPAPVDQLEGPQAIVPDAVTLCGPDERVIFSCVAGDGRVISICSSPALDAEDSWVQYRFGRPAEIELAYPATQQGSREAFTYTRSTRPLVTSLVVRFQNEAYTYVIGEYSSEEPGGAGRSAQVSVMRGEDPIAEVRCEGEPQGNLMELEGIVREE